jgi:hypothetical protein
MRKTLRAVVDDVRAGGATSLRAIATEVNVHGIQSKTDPDILEDVPEPVISGRTADEVGEELAADLGASQVAELYQHDEVQATAMIGDASPPAVRASASSLLTRSTTLKTINMDTADLLAHATAPCYPALRWFDTR